MSRIRDERASALMCGALQDVTLSGRALAVGCTDEVHRALAATGLEVGRWDRYGAHGVVEPPPGPWDRVAMRLPKGRRNLDAMLALATAGLTQNGKVWLFGANDEGIKSSVKNLRRRFDAVETIDTRNHCRLLQGDGTTGDIATLESFVTRVESTVGDRTLTFDTLPGVFADGRLDIGTAQLLASLELKGMKGVQGVKGKDDVLDFGCGAGVIGAFLGERAGSLVGLDLDSWAVWCARRNAPGEYRVSDAWSAIDQRFDHIISNPPFHVGKEQDFKVMDDLVGRAKDHLNRGGRLTFVCPSTAPIEPGLRKAFRHVDALSRTPRFTVWDAR